MFVKIPLNVSGPVIFAFSSENRKTLLDEKISELAPIYHSCNTNHPLLAVSLSSAKGGTLSWYCDEPVGYTERNNWSV